MASSTRHFSPRRGIALLVAACLALVGLALGVDPAAANPNPPVISGVVQDGSTGQGVPNLTIELFDIGDPNDPVGTTSTNSVGGYAFTNVSDGSYSIGIPGGQGYSYTSIFVTVGGSNVLAPTLYVTKYGILSGTVTNYDGTSPITVTAHYWDGSSWGYAGESSSVNADGTYALASVLAAGDYEIQFAASDYTTPFFTTYYGGSTSEPDPTNSAAGIITATSDESISGLDVALTEAGYITGTVKAAGKPVAGVNVAAFDNSTDAEYDAQAPSSSTGAYSIKVPAGIPLEVETDGAAPYELQAWNGHNGCDCDYDPVTVTFGTTQSGINFALLKAPLELITLLFGDDGSVTPEPVPGGIVNLYRQVAGGYKLVDSEQSDGSGTAEFEVSTGGNMRLRISFTDPSDNKVVWLPIEGYDVINADDPNSGNVVIPPNPVCFINLPGLQSGQQWGVIIEVVPDVTTCGPEPAIKKHTGTPPASSSGSVAGTSSDLASVTSTPTPTPTPTPTETTAPTQAPQPSASATPTPGPASSTGGLPWWIWLLIVVGVLVLIGVGVVIFRVRN